MRAAAVAAAMIARCAVTTASSVRHRCKSGAAVHSGGRVVFFRLRCFEWASGSRTTGLPIGARRDALADSGARSQPCPSTALRGGGANLTSTGAVKLAPARALAIPGARRTSPCAAEIAPPSARDEKGHVDFGTGEAKGIERDNKAAFRVVGSICPASGTAIHPKQRGAYFLNNKSVLCVPSGPL